jgi:flagella basal body P-ring formation protein FlgA
MKKTNFLLLLLLLTSYTQLIDAAQKQSISSIQEAVRHYIASNLPKNSDYTLMLGKLDNRLQLPLCSESLTLFVHHSSLRPGRNSIRVTCQKNKPWTVYTTAVINLYKEVLVLSQPINRGEVLNQKNIKFEKRNISTLHSGFLTDPQLIINKQATRNLRDGTVLNKSNFIEPRLIKRGEKVYIKASSPNLDISMAGVSMMDGIKGQNIRVKNITSQQIVQATVVKTGIVEVMF